MSKIFTAAALDRYSLPELRTLFQQAQQDLKVSDPDSSERREALANLENVSRAISERTAGTPTT
ncbi:hypothetical protein ACUXV3_17600 [Roseobacteraceae bacterium NS-SX3]